MSWLNLDFLLRTCFTIDPLEDVNPEISQNPDKKHIDEFNPLPNKTNNFNNDPIKEIASHHPSPTARTETDLSVSGQTNSVSGFSGNSSELYVNDAYNKLYHKREISQSNVLKRDHITIEGILSTGRFGPVLLARYGASDSNKSSSSSRSKLIVLNSYEKNTLIETYQQHIPNRERQFLESFDHPFIPSILGTFSDKNCLYIISPLEELVGGPLSCLLRNASNYNITDNMKTFYASCIVSVLKYAHEKNIIHRGLHPDSLLVDSSGYLKVADWGFAKVVTDRTYTLCGHVEYLCPEAIVHDSGYGRGADYWALGVLVYEMFVGRSAFVPSSLDFQYDGKFEFSNSNSHSVSSRVEGGVAGTMRTSLSSSSLNGLAAGVSRKSNSPKSSKRSNSPNNNLASPLEDGEGSDLQDPQGYDSGTIENILTKEPIYPSYMPHPAKSIIQGLCQKVSTQRLGTRRGGKGIEDIQTHIFFRDVEWSRLNSKLVAAPWIPTSQEHGNYYPGFSPKNKINIAELHGPAFTGYNCPDWNSFK